MSNNDFLVLKNINKSFGKSTVIDNLDLTIKRDAPATIQIFFIFILFYIFTEVTVY